MDQSIVDKIRKLLALATNSNEADMALLVIHDLNLPKTAEGFFGSIKNKILGTSDRDLAAYLTARAQGRKLNIRQGITERGEGPVRQIEGKA